MANQSLQGGAAQRYRMGCSDCPGTGRVRSANGLATYADAESNGRAAHEDFCTIVGYSSKSRLRPKFGSGVALEIGDEQPNFGWFGSGEFDFGQQFNAY